MQTLFKLSLPSMAFLGLGILTILLLGATPLPPIPHFVFGAIVTTLLFFASKRFMRYEPKLAHSLLFLPDQKTAIRLTIGLVIGAILACAMIAVLLLFTEFDLYPNEAVLWNRLFLGLISIISLALMEEVLFRGYPFFRLSQVFPIRGVIFGTALIFGLYHYNSSNSLFSVLLGPGVWGVVFGVAAYLSKSIAVPLGIHISANLVQTLTGLKTQYGTSIWTLFKGEITPQALTQVEQIGLLMQVSLFIGAVIVLEISLRKIKQTDD